MTLLVAVAGCGPGSSGGSIPLVGEAHDVLARLAASAQARDFVGLCSFGDPNCEVLLDSEAKASAPNAPPTVIGTRVVAPNSSRGSVGGRVLLVCGADGQGARYRSEILFFVHGGTLATIGAVFWTNMTIAQGDTTDPSPPSAEPHC